MSTAQHTFKTDKRNSHSEYVHVSLRPNHRCHVSQNRYPHQHSNSKCVHHHMDLSLSQTECETETETGGVQRYDDTHDVGARMIQAHVYSIHVTIVFNQVP